jgi:hypothetical protein
MPILVPELAARIESALVLAAESRAAHLLEIPGNPLGMDRRRWGRVSATLVRRDRFYYAYFNAVRGVGRGTEADLDAALSWFRGGVRPCSVSLSPFDVDQALLAHLTDVGLHPTRFMTVLYGVPTSDVSSTSLQSAPEIVVRRDESPDLDAFLSPWLANQPPEEWEALRVLGRAEFADWRCYVAFVDGGLAAIAGLYLRDGVGVMASGNTIPAFRGRGCQTALVRQRIADAALAGCNLILSQATPGSVSQRNLERAGLRTAYTQVIWAAT